MTRSAPKPPRSSREPRLDFFRGIAMFVIVIAHVPSNPWAGLMHSNFGFSDAAEIFVFCSGIASALAFGATFASRGWLLGTARVLARVWEVYWAHITIFFVIAAALAGLNSTGLFAKNYVSDLNLQHFFDAPETILFPLFTLTYVPNYFDILPMYLVLLALVPIFIALARIHPYAALATSFALWVVANTGALALPAEPWSDRVWFFNPFGWQFLFFVGFAFGAGWLPSPPVRQELVMIASAVVILSIPVASGSMSALGDASDAIRAMTAKTPQAPLRLIHFFALAYLAWVAAGPRGVRLGQGDYWPRVVGVVRRVGQQSLAVFLAGLLLSRLMGAALDVLGRDFVPTALVNVAGIGSVIAVAYFVGWTKRQPWRRPAAKAYDEPDEVPLLVSRPVS